jgi:Mn2+/Fe2+ NRAMP family transporter
VQATRAGALYGLGLLLFILLANALKYPSFRAGPAYAAATGHSLLTGYQKQGPWALALIVLTQFPVQVIILAASALTCAGLLGALGLKTPLAPPALGAVLLVLAWLLVRAGGLRGLIALSRLFVATLTVTTLLATALVLPDVSWSAEALAFPPLSTGLLLFLVALLGLMPSALDLSILHSLWAVADRQAPI